MRILCVKYLVVGRELDSTDFYVMIFVSEPRDKSAEACRGVMATAHSGLPVS